MPARDTDKSTEPTTSTSATDASTTEGAKAAGVSSPTPRGQGSAVTEHYAAWLARYGDCYDSEGQRRAAYADALAALAELREIFDVDVSALRP